MKHAVGKQLLIWDESIDGEVQDHLASQGDGTKAGDITEEERKTEEEIRQEIYADRDFWQFRWSDLTDALTEILQQKNRNGYWKARVRNFGWRSLDGWKYFMAETGSKFLEQILPQTDCHFTIFNYGRGLAIQNFHQ